MKIKKLIFTIVITFMIISGVVLLKNCFSYRIHNNSMGVRSVVNLGHVDTLFIGSSGFRKGIDMEEICSKFPGVSYMLTYNGNEPFNILIELEELIREGVDIKRLIVDFNPSMADRGADLSDKRLLWDISMEAKLKLWEAISWEDSTDLFTFYDYWVLSNNDYMLTYPISYKLISSRYSHGGSTEDDETEGRTKEELQAMEIVENPGVNSLQEDSIRSIIRLCKENDIEVTFLESPRYITMESDKNYGEKSENLRHIIEEEGAEVLLRQDLEFDNTKADYYSDLTHMSKEGKKQLTFCVVKNLKK